MAEGSAENPKDAEAMCHGMFEHSQVGEINLIDLTSARFLKDLLVVSAEE